MMLAKYYNGIEIYREEKIVYVKFLSPHRVISTDRVSGGLSDELEYLYNHQSCEPTGHYHGHELAVGNPAEYKRLICAQHGLPPEKCASLGTAANMNNVAISHDKFGELEVVAACTGGVGTNAGRVGDTASYYEKDGKFECVDDRIPYYIEELSEEGKSTDNEIFLNFVYKSFALGFSEKWILPSSEGESP